MLSIQQLAEGIQAQYRGADQPFSGIHFDSRHIKPGDIFVAIRAERDGHQYIQQAIDNGAVAALVDHPIDDYDIAQIIVSDTQSALGQMAKLWRKQFNPLIIGLTGSCGKTTVKEMLVSIFQQAGKTAFTQGNFNNTLGVPLTLFQLCADDDYLIVEMGTNNPGEIPYLVSLVEPNISLITNIGACHTEGLKSLDGIMQEKGAIFSGMADNGSAVINMDDPRIADFSKKLDCHQVTFSKNQRQAPVHLTNQSQQTINNVTFSARIGQQEADFELHLFGLHQVENALSAIATAYAASLPIDIIQSGLARIKAYKGRCQLISLTSGTSIVDDCYNASFPSVISAIKSLDSFSGNKILILSNMGEMGSQADHYHQQVGQCIHQSNIQHIFLYGDQPLVDSIASAAIRPVHCHTNKQSLVSDVLTTLQKMSEKTLILVKGSRLNQMETVIEALQNQVQTDAAR